MLEHVASRTSTVAQSAYTFNSVPIGDEAADRHVIIAISVGNTTASLLISSVTLGGVAMEEIVTAFAGGRRSSIYRSTTPIAAGTTGQVVVNLGATSNGCHIGVWRATKLIAAPYDTANGANTSGSTISVLIDVPPRGTVVAMAMSMRSNNNEWRGSAASSDFPIGAPAHEIAVAQDAGGLLWTGLDEKSDDVFSVSAAGASRIVLAAASFQFLPNERVFGAVMG